MAGNSILQITSWGSKTSRHMWVAKKPIKTKTLVNIKAHWRGRLIKKMLKTIDMSETDTASKEMTLWRMAEKNLQSNPMEINWSTRRLQGTVNQN